MGVLMSHPSGHSAQSNSSQPWPHSSDSPEGIARALLHSIETRIIPQILRSHPSHLLQDAPALPQAEIEALTRLLLGDDMPAVRLQVQRLRDEGLSVSTLYTGLITPVARHLGELWRQDRCDFVQVTIGVGRLKQLVYELSGELRLPTDEHHRQRQVMLAPVPGSQHTLGLLIVAEYFRQSGWGVWNVPSTSLKELAEVAASRHFDLLGMSLGASAHLENLRGAIDTVRRHSLNPHIPVMVGGPALLADPELKASIPANAFANDAQEALHQANRLTEHLRMSAGE